jgi:hypothetical protein
MFSQFPTLSSKTLPSFRILSAVIAIVESAIERIFAVVGFGELARYPLMPPDLSPGTLRAPNKKLVPLSEVSIDCLFRSICGRVVTVVNDSFSHPTEDRFDYVEKLRSSGQGCGLHDGEPVLICLPVNFIQM